MTLKTVPVTGTLYNPDGTTPSAGASVRAQLTVYDTDGGVVVPNSASTTTASDGSFTLGLWPNTRGVNGSQYMVTANVPGALPGVLLLNALITVPDSDPAVPVPITVITNRQKPTVLTDAKAAMLAAQAALVQAQQVLATAIAVGSDLPNLDALAAALSDLNAIAADLTNLNAVAGDLVNLDALAGALANLNAIAADLVNINAVVADQVNIDAVYSALSAINTCAQNIAAIQNAGSNAQAAANSATSASNSASAATAASSTSGAYPNTAASNVPRGLTQASVGTITPGSGGTNGTFSIAWSGGNFDTPPTGTFTVSSNVLASINITGSGRYIGSSPIVPTPSFAASAGLSGAAVALTAQFLISSGNGYWATSSDGNSLIRYINNSGVATQDTNTASIPTSSIVSSEINASFTNDGNATGATSNLTDYVRAAGYAVTATGRQKIQVDVTAAGTATVYHLTPYTTGWQVKAIYTGIAVASTGLNDITPAAGLYASTGDLVAYSMDSGGFIKYFASGAWTAGYAMNPKPTSVGQVLSASSTRIAMLITTTTSRVATLEKNQNANTATVTANTTAISTIYAGPRKVLVSQRFPAAGPGLPTGWTSAGGTWTVGATGLTPPGAGGWGCYAIQGTTASGKAAYSALARRRGHMRFTINSADTVFGLAARPTSTSNGAVALIDGTANTLTVYFWNGNTGPGTAGASVAISPLVVGRKYTLEVKKDGLSSSVVLTDCVTQQSWSVTQAQDTLGRLWHGSFGPLFISATTPPTIEWCDTAALYRETPHVIIIGDSITEGNMLAAGQPTWAFQLANARAPMGDVVISAKASDTTQSFLDFKRQHDLLDWTGARYVVIALGTNDSSQATWRTNIATIISDAVSIGAEPIICTQIPRTDGGAGGATLHTTMNDDIRSYYFGPYRYIDMALAVTLNHDGINWDSQYDNGDHTHPNYAGQVKMYQQILCDAPYLL